MSKWPSFRFETWPCLIHHLFNITRRSATGLCWALLVYMHSLLQQSVYFKKNSSCVCAHSCRSIHDVVQVERSEDSLVLALALHCIEAESPVCFCPTFPRISCPYLPSHRRNMGTTGLCYCIQVHVGPGDLNSGPGACVTRASFTKLTPKPL